jgi:S-DNA-T family DNA segregation ATPase FtsK/SpoIIIE
LRLGSGTSQHVLVAGKTGSGKSTLLHVIITDLALRYSPDEVEFYLIDFKKGVEFKTYAARRLPHARVIAIESDREFGTSVLERLDAVLKERGDLFRQQNVQDIASFRDARPEVRMPRILLIVDEFQEFFVEDDRYSQTAALLLDRLVRQGRAFGIHVLLGSQTLGGAYSLARTTIGQMAVRIALQCSDTDAHLILSEDNGAARLLTRPGEAIYNDANGMVEGNNPFQVAWLDDAQRDGFLDRVQALAAEGGKRWPEAIVFEGNIPADPSRNVSLCEAVEAMMKPRPTEAGADSVPAAWLGDAVAITGPTTVAFNRRSGANLLIVGQDTDAALGMLANALFSLLAQGAVPGDETSSGTPRMHLFVGDPPSSNPRRWARILDVAPQQVRVSGPDDAGAAISELSAELARRQQDRSAAPPWFILIDDMSRFRDLRKSDDDFGFGGVDREKKATPGQLFGTLLRDGPPVGMHFLVWCDSYNNVDRWFSRQALREFEMRVAFQMSAADSSNLIDSPAASRLGTNRALLYSDERGTAEKFRPYGPPSEEWLKWLHEQLPYAKPDDPATADDINLWVVT